MADALSRRSSLQALARDIGTTKQSVKRWLEGAALPGPENCARIANALKLNYFDVLRLAGHPVPDDAPRGEDPPWLAALIAEMREISLTPREADVLDATVQGLLALREERAAYDEAPPAPEEPE